MKQVFRLFELRLMRKKVEQRFTVVNQNNYNYENNRVCFFFYFHYYFK